VRTRFLCPALAGIAVVLLAACSSVGNDTSAKGMPAAAMAQVHKSASWRIVQIVRHCGDDGLLSVAASGRRDAWAAGVPPGCGADVEHWNGTRWRRVVVPRGVALAASPLAPFAPVTASSARDAWIFPVKGDPVNPYDYALHWDGNSWHRSDFAGKLIVGTAEAFGPGDAWAFGFVERCPSGFTPYATRYDGRSWHQVRVPAEALAVTATSGHNLWVFGPSLKTAGRLPGRQTLIAARWNGRTWHTIPVPKVSRRTIIEDGPFFPSAAAATGPGNLWLAYPVTNRVGNNHVVVVHRDRSRWRRIAVPARVSGMGGMTSDGHGGIWLLADVSSNFSQPQYWYHYSAGKWSRQLALSPRGYQSVLFGMAWVPGSTSVWAVGEADPNNRGHTLGVIARYSP
jgi:hypothetical protein